MKKKKYVTWLVIMIVGVILTQENSMNYFNTSSALYPRIFIDNNRNHVQEVVEYCTNTKPKYIEIIFAVNQNISLTSDKTIYYTSSNKAKEILLANKILPGSYHSLLNGNKNISIENYPHNQSIDYQGNIPIYFISTNKNHNAYNYALLVNKHFNSQYNLFDKDTEINHSKPIIITWFISGIIMIVFTLFEINIGKKEYLLKIINGENKYKPVLVSILSDTSFIIMYFFSLFFISEIYYGTNIFLLESFKILVVIIILNSLSYISLFKANTRAVFSDVFNKKVINYSFFVKSISCGMGIILLGISFSFMSGSIQVYSNAKRFSKITNSYFMEIQPSELNANKLEESLNKIYELQCDIFSSRYKNVSPILLTQLEDLGENSKIIIANENSTPYISQEFPEIFKSSSAIFIHKSLKDNINVMNEINNIENELNISTKIIYYSDTKNIELLNPSFDFETMSVKNPILLFYNMSENPRNFAKTFFKFNPNIFSYSLLSLDRQDKIDLYRTYNLDKKELQFTESSSLYLTEMQNQFTAFIGFLTVALLSTFTYCCIEKLIVSTIILTNNKEIAIKKFLGYNNILIFKKLSIKLLSFDSLASVSAFVLVITKSIDINPICIIVSTCSILIIGVIQFLILVHKEINKSISTALKSGLTTTKNNIRGA